jgi:hypothetical protein
MRADDGSVVVAGIIAVGVHLHVLKLADLLFVIGARNWTC